MEIVAQIKQICIETDNEWFLTHSFPKIALCDLQLKEKLEKENVFTFDERKCTCPSAECVGCEIEFERDKELEKLDLVKNFNIYDYDEERYIQSIWIIPDKIADEIPGFLLIKCCNGGFKGFTHHLEFACVRHKYRRRGILKNMVNLIPKEWNIWLEANSNDIENVENIWEKCGFSYHLKTVDGNLIYKKTAF